MSDFKSKENGGMLFKNKNKKKDSHPDMNGFGNYEGKEFYMSAWIKIDKNGEKCLSYSLKPKESNFVAAADDDDFL